MKLTELFDKKERSLSFEVFPPKTDTAIESVARASERIAALAPDFMSVTYGAGGGTGRYTLEIARHIESTAGIPTVAHLTCIGSTRESVRARLDEMCSSGIKNVLALRGDLPKTSPEAALIDYNHAVDLVREIRAGDYDLAVGGACYPETHPESPSPEDDIRRLREKVDAGVDFLTTQMFFDNAILYRFLDRTAAAGITVPVLAGIMPIMTAAQIDRAVQLSGSYIPPALRALAYKYSADPQSMLLAGIEYATAQITDLIENGVGRIHVYSMNRPEVAAAIYENVGGMLK